jgi:hypothetical protein
MEAAANAHSLACANHAAKDSAEHEYLEAAGRIYPIMRASSPAHRFQAQRLARLLVKAAASRNLFWPLRMDPGAEPDAAFSDTVLSPPVSLGRVPELKTGTTTPCCNPEPVKWSLR